MASSLADKNSYDVRAGAFLYGGISRSKNKKYIKRSEATDLEFGNPMLDFKIGLSVSDFLYQSDKL